MRAMYAEKVTASKGFTLVELAIVMTIIGLLIGGVLKGQEMIQNARVTATIAQVDSYRAAIAAFRDRYDQLPGDFSAALIRLPGCTAGNFCMNGNGNSIIGGDPPVSAATYNQAGITSLPEVETSMFWKHLALADLIAGVSPAADPAAPVWGRSHPSAPTGGGFTVATKTREAAPNGFPSGPLLRQVLSPTSLGSTAELLSQGGAISPKLAAQIDRKVDDGLPRTGFVASEHVGSGCQYSAGSGRELYHETESRRVCLLFFRL
jgi:prepilin-type N-terminal cleavage/methylation domain-containing protein